MKAYEVASALESLCVCEFHCNSHSIHFLQVVLFKLLIVNTGTSSPIFLALKVVGAADAASSENKREENTKENTNNDITYGIDDTPSWYLCVFMALQHYMTMIGAIVSIPFILTPALCMKEDDPARGHIISTMIFVTGLITLLQVTFGCRSVQGQDRSHHLHHDLRHGTYHLAAVGLFIPKLMVSGAFMPEMDGLSVGLFIPKLIVSGAFMPEMDGLSVGLFIPKLIVSGAFMPGMDGLSVGLFIPKLMVSWPFMPEITACQAGKEDSYVLPIVQGGTISFLVPTLAILNLPQWRCPDSEELQAMTADNRTELWQVRMRELSGAIAVSALLQVAIGYLGVIGVMLRYITPLTIVPTVSLVGLSLFENAAEAASKHWGIAMGQNIHQRGSHQMVVTQESTQWSLVPSERPQNVLANAPVVLSSTAEDGEIEVRISVGQEEAMVVALCLAVRQEEAMVVAMCLAARQEEAMVLLTIMLMWGICGLLTVTDYLPLGHAARTDVKISILEESPWFRFPYPGQWGVPTVSASGVLGMLAGVLACTVESISYYPTTARMCGAPPPPVHAINRGIGTEGLGTVLAGLWGSGNGTNTFGENVGAIGVTKIGSRRVIQYAGFLMVIQGVISKFGAVFIIIPEPVVGGMFCVMFGMIAAFGLSALQYVDLNSSRNLYILGFSIFFGLYPTIRSDVSNKCGYSQYLCPTRRIRTFIQLASNLRVSDQQIQVVLPKWMQANPNIIVTGSEVADGIFTVLLSTSILVGGITGCTLDNLIPGTDKERGLIAWQDQMKLTSDEDTDDLPSTYDFPIGMSLIKR
uniref:Solute carrier family 23 member 2 n=1 Tax=Timema genevievae TaxID=629358 RepID=A0A7R9JVU5_TIMGE|nr:unnamed protein product [Timema genevievae]